MDPYMPTCFAAFMFECSSALMVRGYDVCMLMCLDTCMLRGLHAYMLGCIYAWVLRGLHTYMLGHLRYGDDCILTVIRCMND